MSENIHQRALKLIAQARVEGMPETDRNWLHVHLEECDFCTEHARQTDRALRLLRTATISMPAGLASRTQFRVRLRALDFWRCQRSVCVELVSMAWRADRSSQASLGSGIWLVVVDSGAVCRGGAADGEFAKGRTG
jgi:hypothetical protein